MKLDTPAAMPSNGHSRREGILRVRAVDEASSRAKVEAVLETFAKPWSLDSDDAGFDGAPTLTYQVRLKKRVGSDELLTALHEQLRPPASQNHSPPESETISQG
jgi:hypothetical protein